MSPRYDLLYSEEYLRQLKTLSPEDQSIVRLFVLEILGGKGIGLASSHWLKPLGAGLWEFRIGRNLKGILKSEGIEFASSLANRKILIRVFCSFEKEGILVLGCFNKLRFGGGRAQNLAINKARALLLTYRREK
jgi:hypothetical protein